MKRLLITIVLMLLFLGAKAQQDTVFWYAPTVLSTHPSSTLRYELHADDPADVIFEIFNEAWPNHHSSLVPWSLPPGQTQISTPVIVPIDGSTDNSYPLNTPLYRAWHISTTAPILFTTTTTSPPVATSFKEHERYSIKGSNGMGTDFLIATQMEFPNTPEGRNYLDIVATEDSTQVNILCPVALDTGIAPNTPINFMMQRGQCYSIRAAGCAPEDHLSGTRIRASRPIVVTMTDDSVYSDVAHPDVIGDQLVPTTMLGRKYIIWGMDDNYITVVPLEDNTRLTIDNGMIDTVLNYHDIYKTALLGQPHLIAADKPISVFHTIRGGNGFLSGTVPPQVECSGSHSVRMEHNFVRDITLSTVGILANAGDTSAIIHNGQPLGAWTICPFDSSIALYSFQPGQTECHVVDTLGRFHLFNSNFARGGSGNSSYTFYTNYAASAFLRFNHDGDTVFCIGDSITLQIYHRNATDIVLQLPDGSTRNVPGSSVSIGITDSTLAGWYYLEGQDSTGCYDFLSDSIHISVVEYFESEIFDTVVSTRLPWTRFGTLFEADADTTLIRPTGTSCDSVIHYHLNTIPPTYDTVIYNLCPDQLPLILNADTFDHEGIYDISHSPDTIVTLILNIVPKIDTAVFDTVIQNQLPWQRFGISFSYDADTLIFRPGTNNACDSIINYHLKVYFNHYDTLLYYICPDQLPVTYDTLTFDHEGDYSFAQAGSHGEDSIFTFSLHIIPSTDTTIYDSILESQLPWYRFDTIFNDTIADFIYHTYNEAGCDSTIHYYLHIYWNGDHCDTSLTFPNAVTPNGDGANDRFVIGGLIENNCFKYNELTILNRWGTTVYHRRNIATEEDWWDPAADRAPDGTYFFLFKAHGVHIHTQHAGVIEVLRDK